MSKVKVAVRVRPLNKRGNDGTISVHGNMAVM